jgi:hypothetical protein
VLNKDSLFWLNFKINNLFGSLYNSLLFRKNSLYNSLLYTFKTVFDFCEFNVFDSNRYVIFRKKIKKWNKRNRRNKRRRYFSKFSGRSWLNLDNMTHFDNKFFSRFYFSGLKPSIFDSRLIKTRSIFKRRSFV